MTTTTADADIFTAEPVRYTDRARWFWNNGFRRRWLANGRRHAAVINAARRGDAEAVRRHAATLGGLSQPGTFTRTALRLAARLPADLPAYRIEGRRVCTPNLTWEFRGDRQTAKIEWLPLW